MRIVVIHTNDYGQRFADHLLKTAPSPWEIIGHRFDTRRLPAVIDDPEDCLPKDLPTGDLLLYAAQDRKLAELISEMAEICRAKEVLAPVDDRVHLPSGLANQIKRRLSQKGIPIAFPAPFCSLTETHGESPLLRAFVQHFGKPRLSFTLVDGLIREATVVRGAPCGNTHYVAGRLPGLTKEAGIEQTANFFHNHPCMGSMANDREIGDTLLHVAGHLITQAVKIGLHHPSQLSGEKGENHEPEG
jgi:hypothetical protein